MESTHLKNGDMSIALYHRGDETDVPDMNDRKCRFLDFWISNGKLTSENIEDMNVSLSNHDGDEFTDIKDWDDNGHL